MSHPGPVPCLNTECACGFPSHDTVNIYGPSSRNEELLSTSASTLYVFPSMNFSCNGTITDIRMRMDFIEGLQSGQIQFPLVYFLLFHDELTTPNRSVTQILLNTVQYNDSSTQRLTEIWQTVNLSLPVTEGDFIAFAIPHVVFQKEHQLVTNIRKCWGTHSPANCKGQWIWGTVVGSSQDSRQQSVHHTGDCSTSDWCHLQ